MTEPQQAVPGPEPAPEQPPVLPVDQYVARLVRKRMASGILFRDPAGRVLLVEPSYKPNWELPGGAVEADEAPWATAARELGEELGWDRPVGRLLVVDHVRPQDSRPEGVLFVFDGGVIDTDLSGMVFPDREVVSVALCTASQVRERVKPLLADRIAAAALVAVDLGVTLLCEQGHRVG